MSSALVPVAVAKRNETVGEIFNKGAVGLEEKIVEISKSVNGSSSWSAEKLYFEL